MLPKLFENLIASDPRFLADIQLFLENTKRRKGTKKKQNCLKYKWI